MRQDPGWEELAPPDYPKPLRTIAFSIVSVVGWREKNSASLSWAGSRIILAVCPAVNFAGDVLTKYLILLCLAGVSHNPKTFVAGRLFVSAGGVANGHPGARRRDGEAAGWSEHAWAVRRDRTR